jgi:hypothetical protein
MIQGFETSYFSMQLTHSLLWEPVFLRATRLYCRSHRSIAPMAGTIARPRSGSRP